MLARIIIVVIKNKTLFYHLITCVDWKEEDVFLFVYIVL